MPSSGSGRSRWRAHCVRCGVGKDTRVGVLMTNRPEWLSAFFGISLAGGVAVTLSTFSTPVGARIPAQAVKRRGAAVRTQVLKTDFATVLSDLEPRSARRHRGALQSVQFPVLSAISPRSATAFARHRQVGRIPGPGQIEPRELVEATADAVLPERRRRAVLLLGLHEQAQRHPQRAPRSDHPDVAVLPIVRFSAPDDDVRCWSANGFFWSGNFVMSLGATLAAGGSSRAAADLRSG